MDIPTGEQEGQAEAEITVQFVLPDGASETSRWGLHHTVGDMKHSYSQSWSMSSDNITISYHGEALSDATTVQDLGPEPNQPLSLVVQPTNPIEGDAPVHQVPYEMPNTFTVTVDDGKEVLVKVERQNVDKPFLGGYKHKISGVQFLNASAQTLPKKRPDNGIPKYQRNTQTVFTRNKTQQINTDTSTQMNKIGCFVNSREDKVIPISGSYETADQYHARVLSHVIKLQTYWRQWLSRRYVEGLRRDRRLRDEWERAEALRRAREREERARKEFERRMNPHTKEDFDLLYHALEMWRQDELCSINETTSGPERKAALCALLEQEAELIASIGKHKIEAGKEHKKRNVEKFLEATAAPKRWVAFDGNITEMDTQFSLRAQQLRDIYQSITLDSLSRDERLDVLLTLKCTVKEHDCKLTRDIVELVDREADMLVRGLDNGDTLKGLRKRISGLFYQYCKTPLFNPESAKHIKVPQDPLTLQSNVYYCRSCCRYLASTDFELSTNSRVVGHCRQCLDLDNKARSREDFSIYRTMLKTIRKTEESFCDKSHIIFLLQEPDLRYLTENIWGGQSALSAEKDLFELMLVRWDNREQWSPWNTVLLTKEECKGHTKLDNVYEAYGSQFIRKVHHRHVLAKSYFSRIPDMAGQMKSKVKDLPLPRAKEREIIVRSSQTAAEKTLVDAS